MKNNENDEIKIEETSQNNPFREDDGEVVQPELNEEKTDVSLEQSSENDELTKIKQDFESLNNQYLRLAADFDNYRKRQAQEREGLITYGKIDALTKLVEVLDNFDRAEQALKDSEDISCVKEAFNVLHKQMVDSLEKVGLSKIETVGKEFDPNIHDAVMQTPTQDYPDQTIIAELQKGYKLGEKVLRPALVNVATN
ncbi:nucleotide exchange factor GrpE [bacterium]|nr:nucleotide exchange factor GrpE [bacterium]